MTGKPRSLSGNSALKKTITELENLVIQRQQQLETLSAEQQRLSLRAGVVRLLDRQSNAILECGRLIPSTSENSRNSPNSGAAAADASCCNTEHSTWPEEAAALGRLQQLQDMQQLMLGLQEGVALASEELLSSGESEDGRQQQRAAGGQQQCPADPPLGWSPAAMAQQARQCDVTTEGLRTQLRSFVLGTAPLLM